MHSAIYRSHDLVFLAALLSMAAVGCQSTPNEGGSERMMPAARIPFQPYTRQVPIRTGEGNYPNLFSGSSYAVWGDVAMASSTASVSEAPVSEKGGGEPVEEQIVMASKESGEAVSDADKPEGSDAADTMKLAAPSTHGRPTVIHCYLESQFPDMSIAYDAVGLRGIQFHLKLPDGSELLPIQKNLDPNLVEEPVGALRRYGRKVALYFPSRPLIVDNPAVKPDSRGIRLVLAGHGSEFYFEWPAMPDTNATAKKPGLEKDALKLTRAAYKDVKGRLKRLSHELD
jgi:hypothetical protein